MHLYTGTFSNPELHHQGYFRIFRGKHIVEIWAGTKYLTISWGK